MDNDFLKHLDSSQVREIVDSMYPQEFAAGSWVIREGDVGESRTWAGLEHLKSLRGRLQASPCVGVSVLSRAIFECFIRLSRGIDTQ